MLVADVSFCFAVSTGSVKYVIFSFNCNNTFSMGMK